MSRTVRSTRLLLRQPRLQDVDDIYRNIADWDVISMIARPPWPYPRELAEEFVRTSSAFVIEHQGEAVGAISISARQTDYHLGFWLGKRHWGKGLMTEAAEALIAAFFADVGDEPLHSSFLVDNQASWRVQEKLGFVQVGTCDLHINARGGTVPGKSTVLTREAFEARCP